ncbi:MAG: hypothetical protein IT303_03655 [Dehalococcoidia bacterium]|nr:hypothetical protein [Dehalococcoidia bacterium]
MGPVLAFWATALLIAALALPIAFVLLRRLPDRGAGMSFALGLVLAGYGYFILRVLSVLPAGRGGFVLAVAGLAVAGIATASRDRRFLATLRGSWPALLAVAGLFTLFFFAYVAFRSYVPDISGTEQPMDFMYLNAAITSEEYPPRDPWLAGERASYYYFGYLQVGLLSEVSGVEPATGYNLGLAYTFGAAAAGIASLAFALGRWAMGGRARNWAFAAAGLSLVLLLGIGSLGAVFELAQAHGHENQALFEAMGVDWLLTCEPGQVDDCRPEQVGGSWYPSRYWWWWDHTRLITDTITETPFFSFMLGDLHPHVMSIPLVLLTIGIAASTWRGRTLLDWETHRRQPWTGIALAVIFGALAFENAWDVATFSAVLAIAVVVRNLRRVAPIPALIATAGYLAPIAVVAIAAYLPWGLDFSSQAEGIYAYTGPGTRPPHALLQFGPLVAAAMVALTWGIRRGDGRLIADSLYMTAAVPFVPFTVWFLRAATQGELDAGLDARTLGGWVTLSVFGATAWLLAAAFVASAYRRRGNAPILGLLSTGALLLYGAELFYIRDIFDIAPRLNTVFKLTYQAWLLLAAAGAVAIVVALRGAVRRRQPLGWLAAVPLVLVALGMVYPIAALPSRTDGFANENTSIDGLSALARFDPAEYALTEWIRTETDPSDVVIEATGRRWSKKTNGDLELVEAGVDYGEGGRISARTGRSTPIGWYFHEIQWRGDGEDNQREFVRRQDAVDQLYTAEDPAVVLAVMRDFDARYVVVGRQEQQRYPGLLPDFETFLDIAFDMNGLRVYEMPRYRVVPTS